MMRALVRRFHRTLLERTTPSTLALARVFSALGALLAALEVWRALTRLVRPMMVRIPVFDGIPLIPASTLPWFIAAWLLATFLFAIGWQTRAAGFVLALLAGYIVIVDQQTYSNHLYLLAVVLLLLTIADCGAAWSLDARQHGRKADVAAWPVLLLKVQLTVVYVFSSAAKLTRPYLNGDILAASLKQEGWLALPSVMQVPSVMSGIAVASIVAELFIAFVLWSRRLRLLALCAGMGFHLLILGIVDTSRLSLAIFALAMFSMYALFVDGGVAARWEARLRGATNRRDALRGAA